MVLLRLLPLVACSHLCVPDTVICRPCCCSCRDCLISLIQNHSHSVYSISLTQMSLTLILLAQLSFASIHLYHSVQTPTHTLPRTLAYLFLDSQFGKNFICCVIQSLNCLQPGLKLAFLACTQTTLAGRHEMGGGVWVSFF